MYTGDNIKASAIYSANLEEVVSLYKQRQTHLSNLAILQQRQTKSGDQTPSDVLTQITNEETSLKTIASRLKRMGIPADPNDLVETYHSVQDTARKCSRLLNGMKREGPESYLLSFVQLTGKMLLLLSYKCHLPMQNQ